MKTSALWAVLGSVLILILLVLPGCNRTPGSDPANANLAQATQNEPAPTLEPAVATEPAPALDPAPVSAGEQLAEAPQAPPPLPQYQQPPCPGPDYLWTPGYWAYGADYYWVPGAWVLAPYIDALWTPPYWEWYGGLYRWHAGYWGPHIGFYGGINYGFGYTGLGFYGGYWNQGAFVYNRAVANVDPRVVRNVYRHPVENFTPFNRISYNGGSGGINRRPTSAELAVRSETRIAPLAAQVQHAREAAADRTQFAGENRGRPAVAALAHPLATSYRAPAPAPRSWQLQAARQNAAAPAARPETRPETARPAPVQPEASGRVGQPSTRPAPPALTGRRENPEPAPRAAQQAAPQSRVETHPAPPRQIPQVAHQARPAPPMTRPAPQPRVEPRPAPARPAPQVEHQARPAPPMGHPAPQPRAEPHPAPARPPAQQAHPAQRPNAHPAEQHHGG